MDAASLQQPCHFMRIPPEIRTNIYRHLFLSSIPFFLGDEEDFGPTKVARHTAILRANRLIYSEAVALLYSELEMVLHHRGIVDCLEESWQVQSSHGSRGVWRHNPRLGAGHRQQNGNYTYNTVELNGLLEPHVFSRLQHIRLELPIHCWKRPILILVDDQHEIRWRERELRMLKTDVLSDELPFLKNLIQIISILKHVRSLLIRLEVIASIAYPIQVDQYVPSHPSDEEIEKARQLKKEHKAAANNRATECVIEAGLFDYFRLLCNIEKFDLLVWDFSMGSEGYCAPDGKSGEMIRNVKRTVERNFLAQGKNH